MNLERKINKTLLVFLMSIACAGLATTDALAKKGGKGGNAGSGDGGEPEPVYSAAGDLINEPVAGYIDSTNLSFDSIIYRPSANFTFDLSGTSQSGQKQQGHYVVKATVNAGGAAKTITLAGTVTNKDEARWLTTVLANHIAVLNPDNVAVQATG